MGKVIAIANPKGGVGKQPPLRTRASLALKEKVLIIDLDEQANATIGLALIVKILL